MATTLDSLVQLLQASLNPQQHRQAETALREEEKKPGFCLSLLQITASQSYPITSRLAGALCFKNFVKRNWTDEDGSHRLPSDEVSTIKSELVGLMTSVPPAIQSQLGEAISVIADSDFWERWDYLVDDLVSRLSPNNTVVNNGVLQVAHSIFRRWRPLFRSDQLFTEINHVLEKFATPFLSVLQNTDTLIDHHQNNKETLEQLFITLEISLKLFYDLSCQDLPPAFEDSLQGLSALLEKYLKYDNPLLQTDEESEVGPLENVKAEIFEVLSLYVQKYEDAFGPYIGQFIGSSWNLLTTVGADIKNDILASRALNFLSSVCARPQYASTFNDEGTLAQVVEKVILPNLALRESDIEMFEDEPIEFTRRDLEGTDSETRRRAATDFLRQLMQQFQERVTEMVNRYIEHYLQEYSRDPASNWKSKDTAVYLFCSIASVGAVTSAQGVKTVNPYVNVIDFFAKNIAEDLVSDSSHVILQVDAIKYLYIFRSQMNQQQWQDAFPLLVRHLQSPNYVIHTYCAIAVERSLYLVEANGEPVISKSLLLSTAKDMLQRLFVLIQRDRAPEKIQENEFLIRCVMRVLINLKEDMVPLTDFVLTNLVNIIRVIRHNPSNPRFYYYLFEATGALIRYAAPSQPEKLESTLYGPFTDILSGDVQEFIPYVFQLFSALLEANPSGSLPDYYQSLVAPVLMPVLWDSKGNTPALVRLLSSLISRGAPEMVKNDQLEPILRIFQKLISSKANDVFGYDLLETIIASFPVASLQNYLVTIFNLLLTRLANSKTESFSLRFCRLYHFMSARVEQGLGADTVISLFDQVQSGVFTQLYPAVILPESQKLSRPIDRKVAVISFTKTLGDSNVFAEKFQKGWGRTCEALLKIMIDPPIPPAADRIIPDQDVDDLSFGVGFTPLNTCKKTQVDLYPEIGDLKVWIGQYLKEADGRHNGRITQFVQQRLSPELQTALVTYMRG